MTPQELNKRIENIRKAGYTSPTDYSYMQESFSGLIQPKGLKNSGRINTFTQYNDLRVKLGYNKVDKAMYNELIDNLVQFYGDEIYVSSVKKRYTETVRKTLEKVGVDKENFDITKYSNKEIREAFDKASRTLPKGVGSDELVSMFIQNLDDEL